MLAWIKGLIEIVSLLIPAIKKLIETIKKKARKKSKTKLM
jgi:hypothetical protein